MINSKSVLSDAFDEVQDICVQVKATLDQAGYEVPDPTPLSVPVHIRAAMSDHEKMELMIRQLQFMQSMAGHETVEELDDFDIGDDYDPQSPWEENFWPETDTGREDLRPTEANQTGNPEAPAGDSAT